MFPFAPLLCVVQGAVCCCLSPPCFLTHPLTASITAKFAIGSSQHQQEPLAVRDKGWLHYGGSRTREQPWHRAGRAGVRASGLNATESQGSSRGSSDSDLLLLERLLTPVLGSLQIIPPSPTVSAMPCQLGPQKQGAGTQVQQYKAYRAQPAQPLEQLRSNLVTACRSHTRGGHAGGGWLSDLADKGRTSSSGWKRK